MKKFDSPETKIIEKPQHEFYFSDGAGYCIGSTSKYGGGSGNGDPFCFHGFGDGFMFGNGKGSQAQEHGENYPFYLILY